MMEKKVMTLVDLLLFEIRRKMMPELKKVRKKKCVIMVVH
jgi:hypothetical protein